MCAVLAGGPYTGGDSLASPRFVLTAAHKVSELTVGGEEEEVVVVVRCGDWDIRSQAELYPHQDRNILRIITHHGYNGQSVSQSYLLSELKPFQPRITRRTLLSCRRSLPSSCLLTSTPSVCPGPARTSLDRNVRPLDGAATGLVSQGRLPSFLPPES